MDKPSGPEYQDPLYDMAFKGIERGIEVALDAKCYRAVLILIYAGIDALASLARPESTANVRREDFVAWAETYMRIPARVRITGLDLYGARCGMLHQYGSSSRLSRTGKARLFSYFVAEPGDAKVIFPGKNHVILDIPTLASTFLSGLAEFVGDVVDSPGLRERVYKRLGSDPLLLFWMNERDADGWLR